MKFFFNFALMMALSSAATVTKQRPDNKNNNNVNHHVSYVNKKDGKATRTLLGDRAASVVSSARAAHRDKASSASASSLHHATASATPRTSGERARPASSNLHSSAGKRDHASPAGSVASRLPRPAAASSSSASPRTAGRPAGRTGARPEAASETRVHEAARPAAHNAARPAQGAQGKHRPTPSSPGTAAISTHKVASSTTPAEEAEVLAAPVTFDDTFICGEDDFLVYMEFQIDEFAFFDNEVVLFDIFDGSFVWDFPINSFQAEPGTVYQYTTCAFVDTCTEFFFADDWGNTIFESGYLYLGIDGEDVLFIERDESGVTGDSEEFESPMAWSVFIGENCGMIFQDAAPLDIDDTDVTCDPSTSMLVDMEYQIDMYALIDNEVFLHDVNAPGFIWAFPLGTFQAAEGDIYSWFTCVDASTCNEFLFYEEYGQGTFDSGYLSLFVDGDEVLLIEPGENTGDVGPIVYSVQIGNCP